MADVSPLGSAILRRAYQEANGDVDMFEKLVPAKIKGTTEYINTRQELLYDKEKAQAEAKEKYRNTALNQLRDIGNEIIEAPKEAGHRWYEDTRRKIGLMPSKATQLPEVRREYDLVRGLGQIKRANYDLDSIYKDLSMTREGEAPREMLTRSQAIGEVGALRPEIPLETIEKAATLKKFKEDENPKIAIAKIQAEAKKADSIRKAQTALARIKSMDYSSYLKNADEQTRKSLENISKQYDSRIKTYKDIITTLVNKEYQTEQEAELLSKYTDELTKLQEDQEALVSSFITTGSGRTGRYIDNKLPEVKSGDINERRSNPQTIKKPEASPVDLTGAKKATVKTKTGKTVKVYVKNGEMLLDKNGQIILAE